MDKRFIDMMTGVRIIKPPKHTISTFGTTTIQYVLLSEIPQTENQCRLREGRVTAQRPQIITPDLWQKRFEGFGEESAAYKDWMDSVYGEAFRALEYTFKNEVDSTSVQHSTLPELRERTIQAFNEKDAPRSVLLQSPDDGWGFAVMKFIVDYSLRSFPSNIRELNERGLFDPPAERDANRNRARAEALFREAQADPSRINALGSFLKDSGLFTEFEDRFFSLIQR